VPDEDPGERRERLLDGWDKAAMGWRAVAERWREWGEPVSAWLLAHAELSGDEAVLELGAGAADTGLAAAVRLGPAGKLICSDASEPMLELARERARQLGVGNVEFKLLQLEWLDLETASADVVLCRWALMLALDPLAALKECRRVLKPGGRLAIAVWDTPARNPWTAIPQQAAAELGYGPAPVIEPGTTFGLAGAAQLRELIEDAGFFEVTLEDVATEHRFSSVDDLVAVSQRLADGFAELWDGLDEERRRRLHAAIAAAAEPYTTPDGALVLPGSTHAAVAGA
jgi:ubiquinone/menaquinone biosynthesis C-methylase UbiE